MRSVKTLVPLAHLPVLLAGPGPSGIADRSPALSGLLATLTSVSWFRLPPASSCCCDSTTVLVFHLHSAMQRLVAHKGSFPQARVVALAECGTCAIIGAQITPAVLPASSGTPQAGPVSACVLWHPHLDRDGPRVRLPGRDYLLLTGPLHAATSLGWWPTPMSFQAQSPNLFWPADRVWCVATEIDFDSTLVAGTRTLIGAFLNEPILDAWPLHPDDSLASDTDQVNPVP